MTQPMHDGMPMMTQGAVAMHEIFISYVAAGFTEEQAMAIVLLVLEQGMRRG